MGNIKFIFEHVQKHGYWLTEVDGGWINHNFTHAVCKEIIQATDEELEGYQLLAGLTGFNKDKGLDILHKWCHFCSIKECVFGEHWLKEPVLRIRHKLPTVLKTWDFYEFRSFEHAKQNNSLFYNHNGGYEFIQL